MEFREACEELSFNTIAEQSQEFRKCLKLKARVQWGKIKEQEYLAVLDNGLS
jgi:hypothetical protein